MRSGYRPKLYIFSFSILLFYLVSHTKYRKPRALLDFTRYDVFITVTASKVETIVAITILFSFEVCSGTHCMFKNKCEVFICFYRSLAYFQLTSSPSGRRILVVGLWRPILHPQAAPELWHPWDQHVVYRSKWRGTAILPWENSQQTLKLRFNWKTFYWDSYSVLFYSGGAKPSY